MFFNCLQQHPGSYKCMQIIVIHTIEFKIRKAHKNQFREFFFIILLIRYKLHRDK